MRRLLTVGLLALVTIALYARAARFDYVRADDTDLIRGNISFLRDARNIPEAFSRSYFEIDAQPSDRKTYYRPLVIASFILDAQWSGDDPRGYHVTNIAIHVTAVLLLFAFMRRLGAGELPAFVSSLLFAVHSANTQAVCWIPGRNDTLMACFALTSLIGLATYLAETTVKPHGTTRLKPRTTVALHLAGFAAALFTKESALALVPLFVLYAACWVRRGREFLRRRALLASYAAIVAGWYLLRRIALGGGESAGVVDYARIVVRNAPDLLVYSAKLTLPLHLSVMPGLTGIDAALGALSLALVAWLLSRLAPRQRSFVLGWMLLFVLPALAVPGLPAYEHRLYFPLMALMLAVSMLPVWRAVDRRRSALVAASAALAAYAALTIAHSAVFRNPYEYWTSATTGSPYAGIAHVNLGQLSEADGDLTRAAEHYEQALAADPTTPGANNDLGVLLARRGELDRARPYFEREIAQHPANADALFNLGLVEKLSGRVDEAAACWERVIATEPAHAAAHQELASYYAAKGDASRAAQHAAAARR